MKEEICMRMSAQGVGGTRECSTRLIRMQQPTSKKLPCIHTCMCILELTGQVFEWEIYWFF